MLELYWAPKTRAARIVWMLEELGVPYTRTLIDIRDEGAKADPAFRAASPMGKVPAIRDGAVTVCDSAAICLYLADAYPEAGLAPAIGDPMRATYYQWMVYTPGVVEPAMAEKFRKLEPMRVSSGWGDFESMIAVFEGALTQGPWILGDRFTAADVMMGNSAIFMRAFGMLPDCPKIAAYADRCAARPAYVRAQAIDITE